MGFKYSCIYLFVCIMFCLYFILNICLLTLYFLFKSVECTFIMRLVNIVRLYNIFYHNLSLHAHIYTSYHFICSMLYDCISRIHTHTHTNTMHTTFWILHFQYDEIKFLLSSMPFHKILLFPQWLLYIKSVQCTQPLLQQQQQQAAKSSQGKSYEIIVRAC